MSPLRRRSGFVGLHGVAKIDKQRRVALIMISTGLLRVSVWATMLGLYVVGLSGIRHLYAEVSFVTILSVVALLLTDWGQVAASLAQLAAGDAHRDAEHTRTLVETVETNFDAVEVDIARLADLHPGPAARALADEIKNKLGAT